MTSRSDFALSATAVYSLAFFGFWVIVALGSLLVLRLACTADEINAPVMRDE